MNSNSQSSNVQGFVKIISDNDNLWNLLIETVVKERPKPTAQLTSEKIKQLFISIDAWLREHQDYLYNSNNVRILTIMALEKFMNYDFDEINKLYDGKIRRDNYRIGTKNLNIIHQEMILYLHMEEERKKEERKLQEERQNCAYREGEEKLRSEAERKEKNANQRKNTRNALVVR